MPKKILIIRFSSIGDIVLTTPVIRGLHRQLGAEVHFLTKPGFAGIVRSNPHIKKVHVLEEDFRKLIGTLRRERFDLVIDLHKNLRSLRVRLALGVKWRSFDKLNLEKWLLVNFKIDRLPDRHIVDRYLEPCRPFGVVYDGEGLDYFIPTDEEVDPGILADRFFPQQDQWRDHMAAGTYICLVIGAAHATKRLPAHKLQQLSSALEYPVLLMGGPAEKETGEELARQAGGHVVNTCGLFSLHGSASLVRQSALVITHDTGLMHIAAAFARPIISIWGNTVPAFGMYPFYPQGMKGNQTVEVSGLSCRPCSKIGHPKCPRGHFKCMEQIDLAGIVIQAQEKLLNEY